MYKKYWSLYNPKRVLQLSSPSPLNLPAQVKDTICRKDSIDWMEISGEFIAQGNERYITIGHFGDSLSYDTAFVKLEGIYYYPSSYYYIDDVKLFDLTENNNLTNSECIVTFPNTFSPNNDSINDILKFTTCSKILKYTIYNRWGNLIYESYEPLTFWDGKTKSGEICSDGNYFYIITTDEKTYKGFVQLIR